MKEQASFAILQSKIDPFLTPALPVYSVAESFTDKRSEWIHSMGKGGNKRTISLGEETAERSDNVMKVLSSLEESNKRDELVEVWKMYQVAFKAATVPLKE